MSECVIDGCGNPMRAKGLCNMHYIEKRRRGEVGRGRRRIAGNTTHGLCHIPEYNSWSNMLARCNNPNNDRFADYGGRGISVCERWYSFAAFIADMGRRPVDSPTLERINVNGNYEPSNCCWASWRDQRMNQRRMKTVTQ